MDLKVLHLKLGMPESTKVVRKAEELQRLSRVHFNSSEFGVGEVCKSVLCFELACTSLQIPIDRKRAIRSSGMSEKAYIRSLTAMQNALGLRPKVDVRELAIQFGCVRLISTVQKSLAMYQQRFIAALPEARRSSADFNRPVFTAVAFYLAAKKSKLKVDKAKLIDICSTSEFEFGNVVTSMMDICFDLFGIKKEKVEASSIKGNRELLDAHPGKRKQDSDQESDSDDESLDSEDGLEVPGLKRSKKTEERKSYSNWKASVTESLKLDKFSGEPRRATKQKTLSFARKVKSP